MSESSNEAPVICSKCGNAAPFHRRFCHVCEEDIGFPNMRKAASEEPELQNRYSSALESAKARGTTDQLKDFEASFSKSKSVWARSVTQVIELIKSDNTLYTSFLKQIRGNARLAENNSWDQSRESVDSAIHPLYVEEIICSVLSLSNVGAPYYGNCHIVFKTELIEKRASLFEENPHLFMNRHGVITGSPIPKGYRATWPNRGILAVAKLHSKIKSSTSAADYQNILISGEEAETDFIEVHIYGAIHAKTFDKITLVGKREPYEEVLFNTHRPIINKFGIEIIEDPA